MRTLSFIACANRRLTSGQLQHALAIEEGLSELDTENITDIGLIVSVYAGLVIVDKNIDIIRLVHYTIQEYFERTWQSWFPNVHTDMAKACTTYLLFKDFETGFCSTIESLRERLQLYVLYDYASKNWGYHAMVSTIEGERLVLDLLQSTGKYRHAPKLWCMHLTAHFGLWRSASVLLESNAEIDPKDAKGEPPLIWAVKKGHVEVVHLLLKNGADVEAKDESRRTSLSWAAEIGHNEILNLLLATDRVDGNSQDSPIAGERGRSPLAYAAIKGHKTVVKLLLAQPDTIPDIKSGFHFKWAGRTPLSYAAEYGHEVVIKLLLAQPRVDPNSKATGDYDHGKTPLSYAAGNGHKSIVGLLLKVTRDEPMYYTTFKDAWDDHRVAETPLSLAAKRGHESVVKAVFALPGMDPDHSFHYGVDGGRTQLLYAAEKGHEAVVKLLLAQPGVQIDSKATGTYFSSRTPLSFAAENGHVEVVKILLNNGVNVMSKDVDSQTPLSRAKTEDVKQLLLEKVSSRRQSSRPEN
ncbi:ankyrin repeat-containing domain protein [Aspergillus pseudonomiae]|uniref:Ankyrin repeat-containing domain protein n=1 Tax=Aspergillus pseudonomiae TaxID=1506151 RepID=A0A5N6IC46_9EURO|nr:ankyrin repeat-containing domain protein [Aspergillus pseudonomiae]KAB8263627.1 ankyrin repeat-containing domain protein [Aspergillus pseudonomiae]KAE8408491.1 ankyrin repeat-containing domain protein [Aspergillus pseudonomiae]